MDERRPQGPVGEDGPVESATGEPRPQAGPAEPGRGGRSRRWIWTLVLAGLTPAGALLMVAAGGQGGDPFLRVIGGALLVAAGVIVLGMVVNREGGEGEEEEEQV